MPIPTRLIKIGDIYLTDDQTENGVPYLSQVTGLERIQPAYTGQIVLSANGTPYKFVTNNIGKGTAIRIELRGLTTTDKAAIQTLINTKEAAAETLQVVFSNGPDDCDLQCVAGTVANPLAFESSGDFINDLNFDVAINLTVAGVN